MGDEGGKAGVSIKERAHSRFSELWGFCDTARHKVIHIQEKTMLLLCYLVILLIVVFLVVV